METVVVQEAFADFSEELESISRPIDVREGIDSVFLTPKVIRPGENVFCRIKLDADPSTYFNTEVSIFVDDRIIKAEYRQDENSFVATWPAASINDRYRVSVGITRPGEYDKEFLVGSYLVDGQLPDFALDLKGQELNGIVVLQKKVTIMPVMKKPEPIKRWVMTVRDKQGAVIMDDDGRNGLPDWWKWDLKNSPKDGCPS